MTTAPSTHASPDAAGGAIRTTRGGTARWARDFALVGGVSSFLAPFLVAGTALGWPTLIATSAAGALTGALLGAALRRPAAGPLGDVPWPLLWALFLAVGACWGALVGAFGAAVLTGDRAELLGRGAPTEVWLFFMGCAAVAAAAQTSWFAVGYLRAERARTPTWPLLVAAAGTPFLGWAALVTLGLPIGPGGLFLR